MKIHFLNVGHGDCTIIEHNSGRITMVDINNGDEIDSTTAQEIVAETKSYADDFLLAVAEATGLSKTAALKEGDYNIELTNPVEYFRDNFPGRSIFRYIQTHPHLDHLRGLNSLRNSGNQIENLWDTGHDILPSHGNDRDKQDWFRYRRFRQGEWQAEGDVKVLKLYQGSKGSFYNKSKIGNHDGIFILAPTTETNAAAIKANNPNNLSYVLMIVCNDCRVVLGSDAEELVWKSVHDDYGDNLKCHILKASHHGRDSGYYQPTVAAMQPSMTLVSVGKKPGTDASNKFRNYSGDVWSTRWRGKVVVEIDRAGRFAIDSQHER